MFIAALFTVSQRWKNPKCPSTDGKTKCGILHTTEYYSAIKKKEVLMHATTWWTLKTLC